MLVVRLFMILRLESLLSCPNVDAGEIIETAKNLADDRNLRFSGSSLAGIAEELPTAPASLHAELGRDGLDAL